jgi:integrase
MAPEIPTTYTRDVELCEMLRDYIDRVAQKGGNDRTLASVTRAMVIFQAWLNSENIDCIGVTYEDIVAFDQHAKKLYANSTLHVMLKQIRSAYSWAVARGRMPANPFALWIMRAPAAKRKVIIPSVELAAMKAECRTDQDLALWGLLTYTGMRRAEVRMLTWEDVSDDWLATVIGKGNKERAVPIHPELQAILMRTPDASGVGGPVQKYVEQEGYGVRATKLLTTHEGALPSLKSGPIIHTSTGKGLANGEGFQNRVERFAAVGTRRTAHDFRQTVASSLAANGVRTENILTLLGWNVPGVFGKYYLTVRPRDLHEAIKALYGDDPLGR